jgi:hypothetical protein
MSFNPYPTGYFPNINVTGVIGGVTGVFIPYSDLESFNYTVATSNSGDIRQLVYSLIEPVADEYLSLATADKPTQMTVSRTALVPEDDILRKIYTLTLNLSYTGVAVADE